MLSSYFYMYWFVWSTRYHTVFLLFAYEKENIADKKNKIAYFYIYKEKMSYINVFLILSVFQPSYQKGKIIFCYNGHLSPGLHHRRKSCLNWHLIQLSEGKLLWVVVLLMVWHTLYYFFVDDALDLHDFQGSSSLSYYLDTFFLCWWKKKTK